jgi:hypothetical protein
MSGKTVLPESGEKLTEGFTAGLHDNFHIPGWSNIYFQTIHLSSSFKTGIGFFPGYCNNYFPATGFNCPLPAMPQAAIPYKDL